jgi:hypothetical protein
MWIVSTLEQREPITQQRLPDSESNPRGLDRLVQSNLRRKAKLPKVLNQLSGTLDSCAEVSGAPMA